MMETETVERGEVVTGLEFRALHANEHYHNSIRSFVSGVQEAIACGEHLLAAKAEVVDKRGDGRWPPWLENNFDGYIDTARNYMRLAGRKEE
jgi:hypothetical protein